MRKITRRVWALVVVGLLALALAGCGGSGGEPKLKVVVAPPGPPARVDTASVTAAVERAARRRVSAASCLGVRESRLLTPRGLGCTVTFTGGACELWSVTRAGGRLVVKPLRGSTSVCVDVGGPGPP